MLRQLQEKCRVQNKGTYITFVDLIKAFDTEQKRPMADHGASRLSPKVPQLHKDQRREVRNSNDLLKPTPIISRVRQSCILSSPSA